MSNTQPTISRLWPDPETGPYRLRVWIGEVDGRPAITRVDLAGFDPPGWIDESGLPDAAIQATDIRLPLGRLLDAWTDLQRTYARASRKLYSDGEFRDDGEERRRFEKQVGAKRMGRPRLSDEFLREVANIYSTARKEGNRAPAVLVADELKANTTATARGWIRQARMRGFLTQTKGR